MVTILERRQGALGHFMYSFPSEATEHAGVVGCEAAVIALKGITGTEQKSAVTGQVKVIGKKKPTKNKLHQSCCLTSPAALLQAEQLCGGRLQIDSALLQLGLDLLQPLLSLLPASRSLPCLRPALLQLLLLPLQTGLICRGRRSGKLAVNPAGEQVAFL